MREDLRRVGVLAAKEIVDTFKNPTMIFCIVMPFAFTVFFRLIVGDGAVAGETADPALQHMVLSVALCMSIGLGGSVVSVYSLAEAREKHALRTLLLANVSAGQIVAARGVASFGLTMAAELLCFAVSGVAWVFLGWYLLFGALGAVPVVLLSLAAGSASRDQMTAGLYSLPVLLLAVSPMLGDFAASVETVVQLAPTGGMDSLLQLVLGGRLTLAAAAGPLAVTAVWTAVGAAALGRLCQRFFRAS
ncbi:hypothetical protein AALA69_00475 [Eggerthellaceae bacterium 24-137]